MSQHRSFYYYLQNYKSLRFLQKHYKLLLQFGTYLGKVFLPYIRVVKINKYELELTLRTLREFRQAHFSNLVNNVGVDNPKIGRAALSSMEYFTEMNYYEDIVSIFFFLKNHSLLLANQLIDIAVVDKPGNPERFTLYYLFQSIEYNNRLKIVVSTNDVTPVRSLWCYFNSAVWLEREVYDMFGIIFLDNLDSRRILTDYGFEGHPLRKDFPVSGFVEVFYDDSKKRIVYEPISLAQEFRNFEFITPW